MVEKISNIALKLSFISLISFIPILFFMELFVLPEIKSIDEISLFDLNKQIILIATPKNQNIHNTHLMLTLKDDNYTIPGVFFEINQTLKETKSRFYVKITQYMGEPQVQIQKVENLN